MERPMEHAPANGRSQRRSIDEPSQLLRMSAAELDALFGQSPAGPIPDGPADGVCIVASGTKASPIIAKLVNHCAWQGKVFDAAKGQLLNRILPVSWEAIAAKVYKGESWFDKKECIVLDYSESSLIAQRIRDEIRLIGPRFYLGKVYWGRDPIIHFSLTF